MKGYERQFEVRSSFPAMFVRVYLMQGEPSALAEGAKVWRKMYMVYGFDVDRSTFTKAHKRAKRLVKILNDRRLSMEAIMIFDHPEFELNRLAVSALREIENE